MNKTVGEYTLVELLGKGSYAEVYKAVKQGEDTEYAVKIISRQKLTPKLQENLGAEIAIMRDFRHPNIVQLFEILKTENNIYLVLEYCAGGDLHKFIHKRGRLPENVAQYFMRQLVEGLRFLGLKNLIHRDIKPQNLLLNHAEDDATIKIADFGFARHLASADLAQTLCGTPLYMAPEIMQYKQYDAKADLWSVGAVLYEMITGRPPFTGENQAELFRNIQTRALRIPRDLSVSPDVVEVLQHLLERNPLRRASLEALCQLPFINLSVEANDDAGTEETKIGTSPIPATNLHAQPPVSPPVADPAPDVKSQQTCTSGAKENTTDRVAGKSSPSHVRTGSSPGTTAGHVRTPSKTPSAITTMMMAAAAATGSGSSGSPLPAPPAGHQQHAQLAQVPHQQVPQTQQSSPPDGHQHLATSINLGSSTHVQGKGVPAPRTNPFKSPDAAPGRSALRSSHSHSPTHSSQSSSAANATVSDSMAQTREWANDRTAPPAAQRAKQPEEVQTSTGSDDFVMVEPSSHAWNQGAYRTDANNAQPPSCTNNDVSHLQNVVHRVESFATYAVAITAVADRLIYKSPQWRQLDVVKLPVQAALTLYLHAMFLLKQGVLAVTSPHSSLDDVALKPLLSTLKQRFEAVWSRAERSRDRITTSGTYDASELHTPEETMYHLSKHYTQDAAAYAILGDYPLAIDNYQTAKNLMEAVMMRTNNGDDRKAMTQFVEKLVYEIQACQLALSRQTESTSSPASKILSDRTIDASPSHQVPPSQAM